MLNKLKTKLKERDYFNPQINLGVNLDDLRKIKQNEIANYYQNPSFIISNTNSLNPYDKKTLDLRSEHFIKRGSWFSIFNYGNLEFYLKSNSGFKLLASNNNENGILEYIKSPIENNFNDIFPRNYGPDSIFLGGSKILKSHLTERDLEVLINEK